MLPESLPFFSQATTTASVERALPGTFLAVITCIFASVTVIIAPSKAASVRGRSMVTMMMIVWFRSETAAVTKTAT
ncbi:MAG: hypothetical protein ALMCE001_06250 [Methanocorpusculum sp. MCE]|nr:MAG: hypothetical protein ALMCE001_06250 [Methanocorpusculum sp. MCE]